ncbi:MAG: nuclear transport factor 2 family protein [Anaeromyxobacteraceae bacterium]
MTIHDATSAADSPPRRFIQVFTDGWTHPTLETFLEHFLPWMHEDVRGSMPMEPLAVGHEGFREQFRRVFALFPDLRGTVIRAAVDGDVLLVDAELTATLGGKPFSWTASDRFTFRGEKVAARTTSFNPLPLLLAVATRPRAWGVWWRSGVGPPPRRVRG